MDIERSIIESLDGDDPELLPFIPYLLQDVREIGADPQEVIALLNKLNINEIHKVIDLGCGKGAVSIEVAKTYACNVVGIDALPEFIDSANEYAHNKKVANHCNFFTGDIRSYIKNENDYDIVILGAIGTVLGNEYNTLIRVRKVLKSGGYVVLDHGYYNDNKLIEYEKCCNKTDFYYQIEKARFEIVEERIIDSNKISQTNTYIYYVIEKRASELIKQHPDKKKILTKYLKSQKSENSILENDLVCGTWLLRDIGK